MVARVKELGQPALALTDHGNMAGSAQLYKECRKAGILPFPGTELYMVGKREEKKSKRHHLGVVAYTTEGYKNLVQLSSLSHRNFFNKPLVDFSDLAKLSEAGMLRGLAATTGCVSGFFARSLLEGDEESAEQYLKAFDGWFDRTYVELQNHGNEWGTEDQPFSDDQLADAMWKVAERVGLPCVITNDSHYCKEEDQSDHDSLKRLVSWGPDPDDGVFSGDGFALADRDHFLQHHHQGRFDSGMEGLRDLYQAHDLEIPALDKYNYKIPFTVADPFSALRDRAHSALTAVFSGKQANQHRVRLDEELATIAMTGMAGYLLLVAEITDWLRDHDVFFQARGSAAGSMCCWLLGITPVDPLKWDLSFERFISRDRTKPPDIDLDVEHTRRQELIDWLAERFSTLQIGNWRENKLAGEVDVDTGEQDAKGSLRVAYFSRLKQLGSPGTTWEAVPQADKDSLYRLDAIKTYSGYGKHAAGVIITTTRDEIADVVPMMYVASSQSFVSQYAMDDIEALGLVKLDVLGLKTLSVLHATMDNLGREVNLDWIPLTDRKTYAAIAAGDTDGVFQLEGYAARRGCKDLKPTKVSDVIAAMALFRPATMDSGATKFYIDVKHGRKKSIARHQMLMDVTSKTYGILLFQEQVISVLRNLGMGPDDLTAFLKAVKASNQNIGDAGVVIQGYKAQVKMLADKAEMSEEDFDWVWEAMTGFAAYGFNRAHSTVYGLTAYRCAYLMINHPIEFHAALLAIAAGSVKEAGYVTATRRRGIRISKADVEESGVLYAVGKRGSIRKGLMAIKGVGERAAAAIVVARPIEGFGSITSFAEKVNHRVITGIIDARKSGDLTVGVVNKLYEAGALDQLDGVK